MTYTAINIRKLECPRKLRSNIPIKIIIGMLISFVGYKDGDGTCVCVCGWVCTVVNLTPPPLSFIGGRCTVSQTVERRESVPRWKSHDPRVSQVMTTSKKRGRLRFVYFKDPACSTPTSNDDLYRPIAFLS